MKICKLCGLEKSLDCFYTGKNKGKLYYYNKCKECEKERIREKNSRYRSKNRKILAKKQRERNLKNKEKKKKYSAEYYQKNKDKIKERARKYRKDRLKKDLEFRIKNIISARVWRLIKHGKEGRTISSFLPYTLEELRRHLESKFEPWMNWNNWGRYEKDSWDDNDKFTWTWNIDHIVPHCNFNYSSPLDEAFLKCWALENLRPLASKKNILEGNRRLI